MKAKNYFSRLHFILMIFCVCVYTSMVYATPMESKKWFFEFNNCTLVEAFDRINQRTGIQIFLSEGFDQAVRIKKSYHNSSIEKIITDIFSKKSYAIVWNYEDHQLCSIEISIIADTNRNGTGPAKSMNKKRLKIRNDTPGKKRLASAFDQNDQQKNDEPAQPIVKTSRGDTLNGSRRAAPAEDVKQDNARKQTVSVRLAGKRQNSGIGESSCGDAASNFPPPPVPGKTIDAGQDVYLNVPLPVPEKWQGLEPPPMPPGFDQ